jgi:hypothetical protein
MRSRAAWRRGRFRSDGCRMSERLEEFAITVAAGSSGLDLVDFAGGDGVVTAVRVYFPSGCAGKVGVQVWQSGVRVVPKTENVYLRANAKELRFETNAYPTGNAWGMFSVSSDLYDHTIRLGFEINEIAGAEGEFGFPPVVFVPLDVRLLGTLTVPSGSIAGELSGLSVPPGVGGILGGAGGS